MDAITRINRMRMARDFAVQAENALVALIGYDRLDIELEARNHLRDAIEDLTQAIAAREAESKGGAAHV